MDFEKLTELIIELELDDISDAVKEALEVDKKDPFEVLNALSKGMDVLKGYGPFLGDDKAQFTLDYHKEILANYAKTLRGE